MKLGFPIFNDRLLLTLCAELLKWREKMREGDKDTHKKKNNGKENREGNASR